MLDFLSSLSITAVITIVLLYSVLGIWCLVDCAVTDTFSKGKKTLWIIVLAISCLLFNIFYALFITRSKILRTFTIVTFVLLIILVGFLAISHNNTGDAHKKVIKSHINKPVHIDNDVQQLHIKADD